MLIPKKNRVAIYENLFKEGVMVAKKEFNNPKHPDLETVPNLQVIKALQEKMDVDKRAGAEGIKDEGLARIRSLKSRAYVTEQFSWQHYYWYLTNEGITYLRDYLHLPPEIVPATLKRQSRPDTARPRPKGFGDGPRPSGPGESADRETYRRGPAPGSEPKGGAGAGFNPEFRGGFGRGRGGGGFGAPQQ